MNCFRLSCWWKGGHSNRLSVRFEFQRLCWRVEPVATWFSSFGGLIHGKWFEWYLYDFWCSSDICRWKQGQFCLSLKVRNSWERDSLCQLTFCAKVKLARVALSSLDRWSLRRMWVDFSEGTWPSSIPYPCLTSLFPKPYCIIYRSCNRNTLWYKSNTEASESSFIPILKCSSPQFYPCSFHNPRYKMNLPPPTTKILQTICHTSPIQ